MAQAPQSPGGNDNFIRRIVTDPKNVPDVMLLTGYLGASSEEAHERLYLSADLTNYVEIPNTAILHQAPLPKEQDAHGGVTLWVRKDAALQYKMAPAAQALANYFAGAIQAGAQGAPGAAGAAVGPRATIGVHCATFNCSLHCATEITPCINTHANTCFCPVTHACPSQNQLCQSQGACTYVGCGASLACTQGLLCGGVAAGAAAAPQGFGGQAQQAQAAFAGQANLPQSFVGACLSHHFTCAPCPTQHPLQCTFGCTQPPQCVVLKTAVSQCATCFINCTQAPVCLVSAFGTCNVILCGGLGPTQPPCLQNSVPPILCGGVGPGQVPPGTPVEQRQAYHSLANCSVAFCTKVPVICNPTEVTPCIL